MASPKDLQDVNHIKPREIIPLIKNGGVARVVDVDELYLSANTAVFEQGQKNIALVSEEEPYSDPVEEEIRAEFSEHIKELKLRKARLLIELTKRVSALLNEQDSETSLKEEIEQRAARKADLKKEIDHSLKLIKECDVCIATVKAREVERKTLSLTLAAQEQNPDNNLVRFAPTKTPFNALSQNRHTFFGAHRKPENLPKSTDGLEPPTFRN
jgi:hypothetical protein